MTRSEKAARARELRAQGLTLQAIANDLGYKTPKSAWALLNPERMRQGNAEQNRKRRQVKSEWQRRKNHSPEGRATCSECGGLMGAGTASRASSATCRNCIQAEHRRKCEQLEALWQAGKTLPEIQRELGWSKGYVANMVHRARAEGYALPYRYRRAA